MILAGPPFASDFFSDTVRRNGWPILDSEAARSVGFGETDRLMPGTEAIRALRKSDPPRVLTNTEDMYGWVTANLAGTAIAETIGLLKDKARFRQLMSPLYPGFWFEEVTFDTLEGLSADQLRYPFVVKPDVGFLSIGVHDVMGPDDWQRTRAALKTEVDAARAEYSSQVIDTGRFIFEQYLEGEEFAVDAYFDSDGRAVVLGVYRHPFSAATSVVDRIYTTSMRIIQEHLGQMEGELGRIGQRAGIRDFPVHAEFRVDGDHRVVPVELNPLRFGGWCTTADLAYHAWRLNEYELYFDDRAPDWDSVLRGRDGKQYSFVILDKPDDIAAEQVVGFDYDGLVSRLEHPLHLNRVDHRDHPLFGVVFIETSDDHPEEIEWILQTDFSEFIKA